MNYPQYRKYKGINVYFKIISDDELIELKQMGKKILKFELKAQQFPERLFIQDIINNEGDRWETITAEQFKTIEKQIQ